jgi:hypothetical protein
MRLSTFLGLLISAVGVMALSAPGRRSTRWTAVALTTVASGADIEYRSAFRVAADSQPESSLGIYASVSH